MTRIDAPAHRRTCGAGTIDAFSGAPFILGRIDESWATFVLSAMVWRTIFVTSSHSMRSNVVVVVSPVR